MMNELLHEINKVNFKLDLNSLDGCSFKISNLTLKICKLRFSNG